jgi:hypothetical protein
LKKYFALILVLISAFAACKKNSIHPAAAAEKVSVVGNWTWSAEYIFNGGLSGSAITPASTGVTEILNFNGNGNWTQTTNNTLANTGTYSFVNAFIPGPNNSTGSNQISMLSLVNSKYADTTARSDNFNFATGFIGSYALSKDSLVFIGVSTTTTTSYVAERVYVR